MKLHVFTVTLNSQDHLAQCISSVAGSENVVQYIKDGGSSDDTIHIACSSIDETRILAKPDVGIYQAMNQCLDSFHVLDDDYIMFLNSDDYLVLPLSIIEEILMKNYDVYGFGIHYIDATSKITKTWNAPSLFRIRCGAQVPHPGFVLKATVVRDLALRFDEDLKIAADYGMQRAVFANNYNYLRVNKVIANMRLGGTSTINLSAKMLGLKECYDILKLEQRVLAAFRLVGKVLLK